MSDYMFMLESHLSADQNRVLEQVQAAAGAAGVNLFLTGGGMRDMLGGFRIRDLDFSVEGNALKVARSLEENAGATLTSLDENRRSAHRRQRSPRPAEPDRNVGSGRRDRRSACRIGASRSVAGTAVRLSPGACRS